MLYKHRKLILLLIVVLTFGLRFYAASAIVIKQDECPHDFPSARDIYERIYNISDDNSSYKKIAALKLARILIGEGQYKNCKKYIDYVLIKTNNREL